MNTPYSPSFRRLLRPIFLTLFGATPLIYAQSTVPTVLLSDGHAATCKVNVGDQFPDSPLKDLSNEQVDLARLLGKPLTVVLIWNDQQAYARHAYQRLAKDHIAPFAKSGVVGIAINRGDSAPVVQQCAEKYGDGITTLLDIDDKLWDQIATASMPRVYLLDSEGKILWMDMEFSLGTARTLNRAIRAALP